MINNLDNMKTILEYIKDNDEILNIISEVLDNNEISNIEESFLFEGETIKLHPTNYVQLEDTLNAIQDKEIKDIIESAWSDFKSSNFKDEKNGPRALLSLDHSYYEDIEGFVFNNIVILSQQKNYISLCSFNKENISVIKTYNKIEYNYQKNIFWNILNLLSENKSIFYQFLNSSNASKDEYDFNIKDYEEINLSDILKSNNDNSSEEFSSTEENVKDTVTNSIKANKDLLTPLAKEANITGEKLRDIITKVCLDKNGKARKLDDSVILGLSIMLCGVILTVKKSGKSDNSAILAVTNKIASIVKNKKSIKNTI